MPTIITAVVDGDVVLSSSVNEIAENNQALVNENPETYSAAVELTQPGPQGAQGLQGPPGTQIHYGSGAPSDGLGSDGDTYIDTTANQIYYEKGQSTPGSWSGISPISVIGPPGLDGSDGLDGAPGAAGADGQDGNTILNGAADPGPGDGVDGDFWINTTTDNIFGPKATGSWPAGVSIIGPQGPAGSDGLDGAPGAAGADGQDGNTILNGAADPGPGDGVDGDFWINTTTKTLFGPKATGSWPAGVQIAPNPNGCRLFSDDGTVDINAAAGGNAIPWNQQGADGFKDAGISHSTTTNNTRITIAAGYAGRYKISARLNFASTAAQRVAPRAFVKVNGTAKTGESYAGYSRNASGSTYSSVDIEWKGQLNDGDYVEIWAEEGQISGAAYLIGSGSYVDLEQISLNTLLASTSANNITADDSSMAVSGADVQALLEALDAAITGISSYSPGTFSNAPLGSGFSGSCKSRKDDANIVQVVGELTAGISTTMATLVAGHRPVTYTTRTIYNESTSTVISIFVQTSGALQLTGGTFSSGDLLRVDFSFEV